MTQSIGQAIHQSARLLSKAGQEINSLMIMINESINNHQFGNGLVISEDWLEDSIYDDSGFICIHYAKNLGLRKATKRKTQCYLNIQISLSDDGMTHAEANNEEPLIHISLWEEASDVNNDNYFALLWQEDEGFTLQEEVLFNWAPDVEDWTEQGWTYSLKLTSLNSLEDIKNKIVLPVDALLSSNSVEEAGLKNIDGIVKYHELRPCVYQVKE